MNAPPNTIVEAFIYPDGSTVYMAMDEPVNTIVEAFIYPDGSIGYAEFEEPVSTPLTAEQLAAHHDHQADCWKSDTARFGIPGRAYPMERERRQAHRAARITSALRPVRRAAHARRTGAVVARRRTAGTGKPCARGSGDSEPGEPSGLAARAPSTPSAPLFMPAIAAGSTSWPKEATQ